MALSNCHILVINAPVGPSKGFIREVSAFAEENPLTNVDKQRFIDKCKIHLI
jgi:hypothetical protein